MCMHATARRPAQRRKRYCAAPHPTPIQITDRDVRILEALARFRFLDSALIAKMPDMGSAQQIRRRLRLLFDHGYIDRPPAQIAQIVLGNRPMVYGLSDRGAAHLADFGYRGPSFKRLKDLNRGVGFSHMQHSMGLARCQLAFEAALESNADVLRLVEQPDRLSWSVDFDWDGVSVEGIRIVPDGYVGWRGPAQKNPAHLLIEYDRGTEPITRAHFQTSSILRKLLAYGALHSEGTSELENFRVAFITTSAKRVAAMQALYERKLKTKAPPGLFLFTSEADMLAAPLGQDWQDGKGRSVSLIAA